MLYSDHMDRDLRAIAEQFHNAHRLSHWKDLKTPGFGEQLVELQKSPGIVFVPAWNNANFYLIAPDIGEKLGIAFPHVDDLRTEPVSTFLSSPAMLFKYSMTQGKEFISERQMAEVRDTVCGIKSRSKPFMLVVREDFIQFLLGNDYKPPGPSSPPPQAFEPG
jgi:hypothetical protein